MGRRALAAVSLGELQEDLSLHQEAKECLGERGLRSGPGQEEPQMPKDLCREGTI